MSKNQRIAHQSSTPLEIKTSAGKDSNRRIQLQFLDSSHNVRGVVVIKLHSDIELHISHCQDSSDISLPASISGEWVWTFRKTDISLTIHCNNFLVTNIVFSEHMYGHCEVLWNLRHMQSIRFHSHDTASEMYRVKMQGTFQIVADSYNW